MRTSSKGLGHGVAFGGCWWHHWQPGGDVEIQPLKGVAPSSSAPGLTLTPAYQWLGQILYGDQTEDTIYRLIDLNGDGDAADAGEHPVYFNAANASGLASPTGNVFAVHQAANGTVYAGDGDTDTVYRLRDLNGDGDANDAGEARVWFSGAGNAAGFSLVTPNGVADGPDGAIYIVNAGVVSTPQDAIYRTVDLNSDGDANDAGEATIWLDLQTVNASSSAFDLSFIGGVAYLTDTNGGTPDTVYRIEDKNHDGDAMDTGEATVFISDTESYGAPIDIASAAQGDSILTYTWIGNASDPPRVYRLTDLDDSGAIDSADEAEEIWNWNHMPAGFIASVGFSVAGGANGDVIITTNAGTANGRNVVRLTDLNDDGDFMDVGETVIALSNAIDAGVAGRPRAVTYYDDGVTIGHPSTFIEAGSAVSFAGDLTVGDGDSAFMSGARVKIVGGFEKGDHLDIDIPRGSKIKVAYDAKTGELTLAGKGTAAEYQAILQGITFESRKDNPSEALRHISIVVFDERGLDGASGEVATTLAVVADPGLRAIFGSDRGDCLAGTRKADAIAGLDGSDRIGAGAGDDRVSGGDGDDDIDGDDGDDTLNGDDGDDAIDGGRGADLIFGGAGCDTLRGGRGGDRFVFAVGSDKDIVLDFDDAEDEIVFDGVTLGGVAVLSLDDAAAAATSFGKHGVQYVFDGGDTLILA